MENSNKKELNPEELELVNGGSWDEVMKKLGDLVKTMFPFIGDNQ